MTRANVMSRGGECQVIAGIRNRFGELTIRPIMPGDMREEITVQLRPSDAAAVAAALVDSTPPTVRYALAVGQPPPSSPVPVAFVQFQYVFETHFNVSPILWGLDQRGNLWHCNPDEPENGWAMYAAPVAPE